MEKQLLKILLEDYKIFFKSKSIVSIDGVLNTKKDFADFVLEIITSDADAAQEFMKTCGSDREKAQFFNTLFNNLKMRVEAASVEKFSTDMVPDSRVELSYIPIINLKTNEEILINPSTLTISELSYEVWMRSLNPDEKKAVAASERIAKFVYDPYNIETLVMIPFENYEVLKVNRYNPPEWRKQANDNYDCPKEIEKLLGHLFPKEEVLEYILDWMYYALIARNEAYLVLNGAKGIGKGVFCSLVKAMVGFDNYTEAPDSFLESDFNSTLDMKRVILLDEFKVDKQKHTKLKRYINKFQNIEKKGKDADMAVEIFNSYIISNNDLSDMHLEYDDRRFSVVDMTDKNLTDSMSLGKIKEMTVDEFENPLSSLVKDFGYFIFNRGAKKYSEFSVFKGDRYYSLVESSLLVWQKTLLEEITSGRDMLLDVKSFSRRANIKDSRVKIPQRMEKIQDFLNNFRYGGDKVLGELLKDNGDWCIKVNPDVVRGDIEEEEIDDGELL